MLPATDLADDWADLIDDTLDRVRAELFDAQLGPVDDGSTWIVASCGRQAGKNFTSPGSDHPQQLALKNELT